MEAESKEKFAYHLATPNMESILEKNGKFAVWKRSKFFQVQKRQLFYNGGKFYMPLLG